MEISQDMLIDIALNAAGFLLAGLLGVTIYSMFKRTPKTVKVIESESVGNGLPKEAPSQQAVVSSQNTVSTEKKVEFINFGQKKKETTKRKEGISGNSKRNRSEVIRMANAMLAAGNEPEQIKKVLPISDTELALLKLNNNK